MRILLTNDDGILAPGLAAIYSELVKIGEVMVVAPANGMSGASHSITFAEPLVCNKIEIEDRFSGYSVKGSPADCVKLAVLQLSDKPFDLVVSGINNGANAGINVYYSGTVAAAMEGAFLKIPAISVSLSFEDNMDFEKAASCALPIIEKITEFHDRGVININIPRLSQGMPKGVKVVPQATCGYHEYYIPIKTDKSDTVFQLAGGPIRPEEKNADATSLMDGYITVTPLIPDMTDHQRLDALKQSGLPQ